MAAVHQALVGFAQMRGILAFADFVGHREATLAIGLQVPRVVEARRRAGSIAVPADAAIRNELVDAALERQAKGGPAKHDAGREDIPTRRDANFLAVWIPLRPFRGIYDVAPDALARSSNRELVVRKEIGLRRVEAFRPMDLRRTVRQVLFHCHHDVPLRGAPFGSVGGLAPGSRCGKCKHGAGDAQGLAIFLYNGHGLSFWLTSPAITVSSVTSPIRCSPVRSKSIQPSLKPSTMRIRGIGCFMPCERNSASQLSRGTGSMRTSRPSAAAKALPMSDAE